MTRTSPGSKRCADTGIAMTQGKLRRALWICDYFPRPHDMTTGTWALESVAAIGSAGLPVAVMAPTPWIPRALAANPVLRAWSRVPPYQERSEEHTSELQSQSNLVCRLLLEKKKQATTISPLSFAPLSLRCSATTGLLRFSCTLTILCILSFR